MDLDRVPAIEPEAPTLSTRSDSSTNVLQPAVFPMAATVGMPVDLMLSARALGVVDDIPTLTYPGGTQRLNDDGTGGDRVAGDGMWSAQWTWTPTDEGTAELLLEATVDGMKSAETTSVTVLPAATPSGPETPSALDVVTDGDVSFVADRIVVITEEDVDPEIVDAAADLVGGDVVGFVGPGVWQIAVQPVGTLAELQDTLRDVSTAPGIIGAEPDYVSGSLFQGDEQ